MPNSKAETLREFDALIADLQTLSEKWHVPIEDRYDRGPSSARIDPEKEREFLRIRTHCLALLARIKSQDFHLTDAIDEIRGMEVSAFNAKRILTYMQTLRSDYDADILTEHPRFSPFPAYSSEGKRSWLDENRTTIIVAIIGLIATIVAALISRTPAEVVVVTATPTSTLIATTTVLPVSTAIPTITITAKSP